MGAAHPSRKMADQYNQTTGFTITRRPVSLISHKLMWFSWMDNRTLLACQVLLTMVYAIAFVGMRRMHRHLPGTGSFALGFSSGFLGCALSVVRSNIPNFVFVVMEYFLFFSAFVLFYRGILHFFRSPRMTGFLWTLVSVALLLLLYFSTVDDRVAPRIVIISLVLFLVRGLIAVELFRQAGQRSILNVFALLMAVYALFGLTRCVTTLLHGLLTISCRRAVSRCRRSS